MRRFQRNLRCAAQCPAVVMESSQAAATPKLAIDPMRAIGMLAGSASNCGRSQAAAQHFVQRNCLRQLINPDARSQIMHIRFSVLEDYIETLHIEFHASTRSCSSTIDFETRPSDLKEFGQALCTFSGTENNHPVFETGSPEEPYYSWLRLRAFSYDSLGHSALEVSTNINGSPQIRQSSHFCGKIEVAAINRLGKEIIDWEASKDRDLQFEASGC